MLSFFHLIATIRFTNSHLLLFIRYSINLITSSLYKVVMHDYSRQKPLTHSTVLHSVELY